MTNTRSLATRVVSMVLVSSVLMGGVVTWLVLGMRRDLTEAREEFPRVAVEAAASQVSWFAEQEARGALSRADAQQGALNALRHLRFDDGNYVWVNDLEPRMVMHPLKPELDGTALTTFKDPAGTALFVEMVQAVKASPTGDATVGYLWPKPGSEDPVPKISYVKLVPQWGWVLGAGVYTDDVRQKVGVIVLWATGVMLGALLLSIAYALWLSRRISQPLITAIDSLDAGSTEVAEASGAIANISETLAREATGAAAEVQQSGAAVGHVSERTRSNASDAKQMQALMEAAAARAEATGRALESIVKHMTKVRESNGKVMHVVKTIDELAFQTNLLALNAAVEAARAGQAGAGFAVVAQEVRALAQRSAEAAHSTADMIEGTVNGIVAGTTLIADCSRSFESLREHVNGLTGLVTSIAQASAEQASNLGEVGQGLSALDASTQRTASSADEIANQAMQLNMQASMLQAVVQTINVLVVGDARAQARARSTTSTATGDPMYGEAATAA